MRPMQPARPIGHGSNTVLSVLSQDDGAALVEQWALPKAVHNPWIAVRGTAAVPHSISCATAADGSTTCVMWNGGGGSAGSVLRVSDDDTTLDEAPADSIALISPARGSASCAALFRNGDVRDFVSGAVLYSGGEVVISAAAGGRVAYVDVSCRLHIYPPPELPNAEWAPLQLERIPPFLNVSPCGHVHYVTFAGEIVDAASQVRTEVASVVMGVASNARFFACLVPFELLIFDIRTLQPLRRHALGDSHTLGTVSLGGDVCIGVFGTLSLVLPNDLEAPPKLMSFCCPEGEPALPRLSCALGADTVIVDALGVLRIGTIEVTDVPTPRKFRHFSLSGLASAAPSLIKSFDDGRVVTGFYAKGTSTVVVLPDNVRLVGVKGLVTDCCWTGRGVMLLVGPGVAMFASLNTDSITPLKRFTSTAPLFACVMPKENLVVAIPRAGRLTLVDSGCVKETSTVVEDVVAATACSDGAVRLLSLKGDVSAFRDGVLVAEGRVPGMTPSARPMFVGGRPMLLHTSQIPGNDEESEAAGAAQSRAVLCGASRHDNICLALQAADRTPIVFAV